MRAVVATLAALTVMMAADTSAARQKSPAHHGSRRASKESPAKKSPAKKPAAKKAAAKKPAGKPPAVEKPVAKKPAAKKPAVKKPVVEKPMAEKPAAARPDPEPAQLPAPLPDGGAPEAETPVDLACMERLRGAGVRFEAAPPTRGVRTPVVIQGPLGQVHLVHRERHGRPPLMDCELARALLELEPVFAELGVDELRFSGAYQYRFRRGTTRLSEHSHGLAIDVHAFHLRDGRELDVRRDFAPDAGVWGPGPPSDETACIGAPAAEPGRQLRTLACRLRMSSAVRTVMTPDDDEDHHDHFHLETFPDAATRTRIILQRARSGPR